jgi:16S rRNA (guanine527-N7)-methyltransferase
LQSDAQERFGRLLEALAAEPDPPTTLRDPDEAVDAHLADSLSGLEVEKLGRAASIADVGSGAGFPGLVLAIALPDARVDLIEAARKKAEVIERLAATAEVANTRVLALRAEEWAAGEGADAYDAVTVRAVDSLAVLVEYAAPLLRIGGVLVAWKGAVDPDEQRRGERAAALLGLEPVGVRRVEPFEGAKRRHLHVYAKTLKTPGEFPRRPGMARKHPLA